MIKCYCFKFVTFCMCVFAPLVVYGASVTLEWDPVTTDIEGTPISNLEGYRLFQSTSSLLGMTTQQAMAESSISKITILSPAVSTATSVSYSVTGLKDGTTYFFRLTAYNTSGIESGFNVDYNGTNEEMVVFILPLGVPVPFPRQKITTQISYESIFDLDTKYLHGDLMLIKVKVEEGSTPIFKVNLRYSDAVPDFSAAHLTYSLDMVKVSSQVYAAYVDTRKLNETGVVSFHVEAIDSVGDIVTTSQGQVRLDSKVEITPKLPGVFEVFDGNPADGENRVYISPEEQVNQVEFKRLPLEQFPSRGERDIDNRHGDKPIAVYDLGIIGRPGTMFRTPASLTLVYYDLDGMDNNNDGVPDGDGFVDGTNIPEQNLGIFWYDGLNWRLMGGQVDSAKNTVTVQVQHFSVYGIFPITQYTATARAQEKFLTPTIQDGINDAALFGPEAEEVTVFDVSGRKIFHTVQTQGTAISWNCRDESGNIVESGVYIAKIKQKDGKIVYQCFAVVK